MERFLNLKELRVRSWVLGSVTRWSSCFPPLGLDLEVDLHMCILKTLSEDGDFEEGRNLRVVGPFRLQLPQGCSEFAVCVF